MTIQVQPEVFLQLSCLHHGESSSKALQLPQSWPITSSAATVLKDPCREDLISDDDTLSTASSSDCGSEVGRSVSFADDLVSEVHTRPFTPPEQVQELYYSQEETSRYVGNPTLERSHTNVQSCNAFCDSPCFSDIFALFFVFSFRQDYRLERKLLNGETAFEAEADSPRRGISRVVVHPNNSDLAAVYDCEDDFDTPEFWSGSITWW